MRRSWPPLPADWAGPEGEETDCVLVSIDAVDAAVAMALRCLLSDDEAESLDHFRRDADKVLRCVAWASLRLLLGRATNRYPRALSFGRTALGKPFLPDGPQFNLAHGGGGILIGITATAAVGVDIEPRSSAAHWPDVIGELRASERMAVLQAANPGGAFLRAWTRKEAVAKADGRGLALSPDKEDRDIFQVFDLDLGFDHAGAVATRGIVPPRCWRFAPV